MYQLLKPLLFTISPEKAHHFTTRAFNLLLKLPFGKTFSKAAFQVQDQKLQRNILGLDFPNPVGLAAGFDKNAELIDDFTHLGFGFIEIGTVTPKGQPGNPSSTVGHASTAIPSRACSACPKMRP